MIYVRSNTMYLWSTLSMKIRTREFPNNKLYSLSAYLGLTGFYKLPG